MNQSRREPTDARLARREVLGMGLFSLTILVPTPASRADDEPGGRWEGSNLRELTSLTVEGNRCWATAFSPDGSLLAAAGFLEGVRPFWSTITLWDTATWKPRSTHKIDDIRIHRLAFTPDGMHVLAAGLDRSRLIVYETTSGKVRELYSNPETGGSLSQFVFSPDGEQFWIAGPDGVMVWEVETWLRAENIPSTRDQGYQLATVAPKENWNTFGGWLYGMNGFGAVSAVINPRPFGREGGRFPRWRFDRVRGVERPWVADQLACSRDGMRAAISTISEKSKREIAVYDIERPEIWRSRVQIDLGEYSVYALTFSPDARSLVAGGSDKAVRFWDAATGRELPPARGHNGAVSCLAWSPDLLKLATAGGSDTTVKVWNRHQPDRK